LVREEMWTRKTSSTLNRYRRDYRLLMKMAKGSLNIDVIQIILLLL